jgi:hypothetical protein
MSRNYGAPATTLTIKETYLRLSPQLELVQNAHLTSFRGFSLQIILKELSRHGLYQTTQKPGKAKEWLFLCSEMSNFRTSSEISGLSLKFQNFPLRSQFHKNKLDGVPTGIRTPVSTDAIVAK